MCPLLYITLQVHCGTIQRQIYTNCVIFQILSDLTVPLHESLTLFLTLYTLLRTHVLDNQACKLVWSKISITVKHSFTWCLFKDCFFEPVVTKLRVVLAWCCWHQASDQPWHVFNFKTKKQQLGLCEHKIYKIFMPFHYAAWRLNMVSFISQLTHSCKHKIHGNLSTFGTINS